MIVVIVIWLICAIFIVISISGSKAAASGNKVKKVTISSDGHRVARSQDLTCTTRYGHKHQETSEFGKRYIVHEEPEIGYVILNGKKRKLTDCKNL